MNTSSHCTGDIYKYKEQQWIIIGGRGGGVGGGGGGFNKTWPILVIICPLIYVNLHVKYGINLIRTFLFKVLTKLFFCLFVFYIGLQNLLPIALYMSYLIFVETRECLHDI